ncbi:DMT family transporter [Aerococcus sanguinicola]|uniref:DMT family transporter n=1 Tax=unclassified Aerococcus TaxID=2618060 RepID=UPI0008A29F1B|nr:MULTISPECIES: DMT family transporter [unclassified Aerococcus]KAB0645287.1 DMT family transporter [Aerococcus sanguinicola]MDK6234365.1 DMT family transporter [Aerococcus sp. UMB10185]MDK6856198.1 DMT family transporter [Aerococcus sp. UMB7533]MDK8503334.1 DMT family transporter [Aerococcus sp. UMB1112A]OFN05364.1 hypothetical protein HMPREF2626_03320 [Aerococcus sp. HMSC062A02]
MTNRNKGIIAILISAFGFAVMNLCIPLAGDLPTIEKSFFRNIVAFVVALTLLMRSWSQVKNQVQVGELPWKTLLLRSILGTIGVFCNYYALDHLFLSDASVLNKLAPFATLVFSAIFLKERMDKQHLIALGFAFVGVLLVSKPTGATADLLPYLVAILGGLSAGGAYTAVRQLNKQGVPSAFTVAFFSGFSCLVCVPYLIFNYVPLDQKALLALLGAGLAASFGQFGITLAYKFAPANEISIFDYSSIVFSGLLGFIFLGQVPDGWSILGYFIIFTGGLVTFLYNRQLTRKQLSR